MRNKLFFFLVQLILLFLLSVASFANDGDVRFEQKLGTQLSPQTSVFNERGLSEPLGNYFGKKPIILSFVYYGCPNLCTLVLNGLADAVQSSGLHPGRDVTLMSISIDPKEKPSLSLAKKRSYLARILQTGDENPAWHFLTAPQSSIQSLTSASGFHFKYDPLSQEYNHPSGIIILTAEGTISRYFFGIRFDPADLKAAISDAGLGKSHRTLTEVILNCFHYSPTGKYGNLIITLLQAVSLMTVVALSMLLLRLGPKKVVHD
jgi:protein SCO1/2